jgi:predicted alpha/beta superfamily hydrolase
MRHLMKRISLHMVCAAVALGGVVSNAEAQPVVISNTQQFTLVASDTQRVYRVFVDVPTEPPVSSAGYPVVYFLDGNATFLLAAGAWRLQATLENGSEPAVVVAVGYEAEELFTPKARYFDLTPRPDRHEVQQFVNGNSSTEFGGADAFFKFLQGDLKPLVQQRFNIDPTRQTLFGHSFGGLFVLYTLFTHPDAFSAYVAGSPSIWWNSRSIFRDAERFGNTIISASSAKRLLIGVGAQEPRTMIEDARKMANTLRSATRLEVCFMNLHDEDHMSVIPVLVSRAVRFALSRGSCRNE